MRWTQLIAPVVLAAVLTGALRSSISVQIFVTGKAPDLGPAPVTNLDLELLRFQLPAELRCQSNGSLDHRNPVPGIAYGPLQGTARLTQLRISGPERLFGLSRYVRISFEIARPDEGPIQGQAEGRMLSLGCPGTRLGGSTIDPASYFARGVAFFDTGGATVDVPGETGSLDIVFRSFGEARFEPPPPVCPSRGCS